MAACLPAIVIITFLASLSVVQFHISCFVVISNGLFILSNEDPVLVALGRLKRFYRVKIKI